jgi:hypothetical protein
VGQPSLAGERTGLDHVGWLRISVGRGVATAEAVGVGRRKPARVPVSLSLASELAAGGVPLVVRHTGDDDGGR